MNFVGRCSEFLEWSQTRHWCKVHDAQSKKDYKEYKLNSFKALEDPDVAEADRWFFARMARDQRIGYAFRYMIHGDAGHDRIIASLDNIAVRPYVQFCILMIFIILTIKF